MVVALRLANGERATVGEMVFVVGDDTVSTRPGLGVRAAPVGRVVRAPGPNVVEVQLTSHHVSPLFGHDVVEDQRRQARQFHDKVERELERELQDARFGRPWWR